MAVIEIAKIQVRRGQENQTGMPQLDSGEFGWAEDSEHLYIGKRIVDGAVDDNNTRILTENDLDNLFSLFPSGGSVASTSTYRYRDGVDYIHSVVTTVGRKLDTLVSLTDYGVTASSTATDITIPLTQAIDDLFYNSNWDTLRRSDARRQLIIPAGNYYISNTINLPPYTSIVGSGPDITSLIMTTNYGPMFSTMDAIGNTWNTGNMQSGIRRARSVSISDMTIEYQNGSIQSDYPLVSLDNVLDARVENAIFRTAFTASSTTTYGLTNYGTGIQLRGSGGGLGSGDVNLCEDIEIVNCKFDGLYVGVAAAGTIIRPVIDNSIFSNLHQGIRLTTPDTLPGPSNGLIKQSRFENIVNEAIYVGANPDNIPSNHVTSENFFIQVGNGLGLDDFVTTSTSITPIITFLANGNKSVDNYFYRQELANTTTDPTFYFNPLIQGRAAVNNGAVFTATILTEANTPVANLCLTDHGQHATIKYQLTNDALMRSGTLTVDIRPDGEAALTDMYNYTEEYYIIQEGLTLSSVGTTTSTQFSVNVLTNPNFASGTFEPESGIWYLTGSDVFKGYSAAVTFRVSIVGNIHVFETSSADPQFNFTTPNETYTLLRADSPNITFEVGTPRNNYVPLRCYNGSNLANAEFEYQIDLLL